MMITCVVGSLVGRYRAADAGTFTCHAGNEAGNASIDVHLTVHGLSVFITILI